MSITQWDEGFEPSTYKFLDALGKTTSAFSNIGVILTWQPNLEVPVRPKAKSKRSYYSSLACGSWL